MLRLVFLSFFLLAIIQEAYTSDFGTLYQHQKGFTLAFRYSDGMPNGPNGYQKQLQARDEEFKKNVDLYTPYAKASLAHFLTGTHPYTEFKNLLTDENTHEEVASFDGRILLHVKKGMSSGSKAALGSQFTMAQLIGGGPGLPPTGDARIFLDDLRFGESTGALRAFSFHRKEFQNGVNLDQPPLNELKSDVQLRAFMAVKIILAAASQKALDDESFFRIFRSMTSESQIVREQDYGSIARLFFLAANLIPTAERSVVGQRWLKGLEVELAKTSQKDRKMNQKFIDALTDHLALWKGKARPPRVRFELPFLGLNPKVSTPEERLLKQATAHAREGELKEAIQSLMRISPFDPIFEVSNRKLKDIKKLNFKRRSEMKAEALHLRAEGKQMEAWDIYNELEQKIDHSDDETAWKKWQIDFEKK